MAAPTPQVAERTIDRIWSQFIDPHWTSSTSATGYALAGLLWLTAVLHATYLSIKRWHHHKKLDSFWLFRSLHRHSRTYIIPHGTILFSIFMFCFLLLLGTACFSYTQEQDNQSISFDAIILELYATPVLEIGSTFSIWSHMFSITCCLDAFSPPTTKSRLLSFPRPLVFYVCSFGFLATFQIASLALAVICTMDLAATCTKIRELLSILALVVRGSIDADDLATLPVLSSNLLTREVRLYKVISVWAWLQIAFALLVTVVYLPFIILSFRQLRYVARQSSTSFGPPQANVKEAGEKSSNSLDSKSPLLQIIKLASPSRRSMYIYVALRAALILAYTIALLVTGAVQMMTRIHSLTSESPRDVDNFFELIIIHVSFHLPMVILLLLQQLRLSQTHKRPKVTRPALECKSTSVNFSKATDQAKEKGFLWSEFLDMDPSATASPTLS